jgi:hypothetical protein
MNSLIYFKKGSFMSSQIPEYRGPTSNISLSNISLNDRLKQISPPSKGSVYNEGSTPPMESLAGRIRRQSPAKSTSKSKLKNSNESLNENVKFSSQAFLTQVKSKFLSTYASQKVMKEKKQESSIAENPPQSKEVKSEMTKQQGESKVSLRDKIMQMKEEKPLGINVMPSHIFEGIKTVPKKRETTKSQEWDVVYRNIDADLRKLESDGGIDPIKQGTIRSTVELFATYDANLKKIIPSLAEKYGGKDKELEASTLAEIQRHLHPSTGSHLGRIKNPTLQKIEQYFQGQLNQVEDLYQTAKKEENVQTFFEGCYSRFPGCFEDRIAHLYDNMTAEKENQAVMESSNITDNLDPLLPSNINVATSTPDQILTHYHNAFTRIQEQKMKLDHPKLSSLNLLDQLNYRENHQLDDQYLSFPQFKDFLATTKIKQLMTDQGLIQDKAIQDFWNTISL